ncbi:MAG: type II toxin-antitoxin system RelE/ParE family toxin [Desulfobacterales bacterium]|nr:type II toxin-antitoxin system RelE/ParE family toxin [Desulfobacterales bacterium]
MDKKWQILFCDETETECPVTEFINECTPAHQVKVLRILSLLEEKGPILPRPYADILYNGIHELRVSLARNQVRILYFFCYERFIVLYHVFFKTTRRVPDKYVAQVAEYRETFLEKTSREELERQALAVF